MGAESSKIDWTAREQAVKRLRLLDQAPEFFNRKEELGALLDFLSRKPSSVQVVVGPNDCGKTRMLRRLQELWALEKSLVATSPIFYVDLRKLSWRTPRDAAPHLIEAFRGWAERFGGWASSLGQGVSLKIPGVEVKLDSIMDAFLKGVESHSDLSAVMMRFVDVVDANPTALPIFILDEADRLKEWDARELTTFMGCFKSLVKQDRRAYLLLCSSDDFFREWLKEMFHPGQWRPFGVGFFAEQEAQEFFTGYCIAEAGGNLPSNYNMSDWEKVYDICGGSPLLLQQCAVVAATDNLTWKESAEALMWDCVPRIEAGLAAKVNVEGFEGEKYKCIIKSIADDGFIGLRATRKDIFKKKSEEFRAQIKAMLHGNYIHVRYVTPRTRYADIETGSFGDEIELVMARSPADRAAMRVVLAEEN